MAHPLLERAAQHVAQARAINDEFEGKAMPAEAAHTMQEHLKSAAEYRGRVEREASLLDQEKFLSEPEYKHDMAGGGSPLPESFGRGSGLLDSERKELKRAAFWGYIRHGDDGLTREQKAALVEDTTSGGQNLVPTDYAGTILKELPREGSIRSLATVRPTSSNKVDVGNVTIGTAGWGALELTSSTTTDGLGATPGAKDTITVYDLTALVLLGEDELEDADGLESIVREALVLKYGELEDDAFAFGSGSGQPTGIATGSTITQLVTASADQTLVGDDVIKLQYAVPTWATRGAVYLGHREAAQAASLLKDSNGAYIWRESFRAGEPPTLAGYPFYRADGLPAMSASTGAINTSLVFGSVKQGYLVADRQQITVKRLVERYAEQGKIGLLFKHRVGGGIIRPKAFSALKI